MSLNLAVLGGKLAAYRRDISDTVEEVAAATGVAIERIAAIEAGEVEPNGDEILILSDYFRCDYKVFLTDDALPYAPPAQTLYRARSADFSKEDRRAIRDFIYLCETEHELEQDLGRHHTSFELPHEIRTRGDTAAAALAVRARLGYEERHLPLDVFGACRKLGVRVFRRSLGDSNISGLFIVHPVAGKCILVNSSEDAYRQRFSAAHELAHALFDAGEVARVSLRSETGEPLERRANGFASAFLMPPHLLRLLPSPEKWSDDDARRWANEFKVSCDAFGIALHKARVLSYSASGHIRGLRVPLSDKVDPELPSALSESLRRQKAALLDLGLSDHYVGVCFEAHRNGMISTGRLAEALLLSHGELQEVAALYGRGLHVH
jgi:Zn-dependent peptidase ImmA (M78 family)/DNA-binding XRE family transcriptional regulator